MADDTTHSPRTLGHTMNLTATERSAAPAARRLGPWTLLRQLGEGSSGSVYEAVDAKGRRAAVKRLAALPGNEWRALCQVTHPAIVTGMDCGGGAHPYIAMELATGAPLASFLHPEKGLDVATTVQLGGTLASALEAVHAAGIHHGDVKPENIVLDRATGRGKLVDFGLSGMRGGTVAYVAPEIFATAAAGPAGDVYSLGMTLWAVLHRRAPDAGSDGLFARIHKAPPVDVGPQWLRGVVRAMLSPRPEDRPTAHAVVDIFSANGVQLPTPDAQQILRRAAVGEIDRPRTAVRTQAWLAQGGSVAIVGPAGSGRTHTLRILARELEALGRSVIWLSATPDPRAALAEALTTSALPGRPAELPRDPSALAEARLTAEALLARSRGPLWVLVDEFELLDADTRQTIAHLCNSTAAHVAIAATEPGSVRPLVDAVFTLQPMSDEQTGQQIKSMLGSADPVLIQVVQRESAGLPKGVVDAVLGALHGGALVYRRSRWLLDEARLTELVDDGGLSAPTCDGLSDAARAVGAVLALSPTPVLPVNLATLGQVDIPTTHDAIAELAYVNWAAVHPSGAASCASAGARAALTPDDSEAERLHRAMANQCLAADNPAPSVILHHLIGCRDAEALRLHATAALEALLPTDLTAAGRLAARLWQASPQLELAEVCARALVRSDRTKDALGVLQSALDKVNDGPLRCELLIQRALLYSHAEDWDQALLTLDEADSLVPGHNGVLDARAKTCFRARRYGDVIEAAKVLAGGPPPTNLADVDTWIRHRGLWAQSVLHDEGATQALGVLSAVPEGLAQGRTSAAVLDGIRGRLLWHAGDIQAASMALRRAASSSATLSTLDRSQLQNNAGLALYQSGLLDEAVDHWEQSLLGFERLEQGLEQLRVKINLCQGLGELGRWARARELGLEALQECERRELIDFKVVVLGNLGDLAMTRESWSDALQRFDEAQVLATKLNAGSSLAELARRRAELAARTHDPELLPIARAAVASAEQHESTFDLARSEALLALAQIRNGGEVDLAEVLERICAPLRGSGAAGDLAIVRRWIALALLEAGHPAQATELASEAIAWADEVGHEPLRRDADRLLSAARAAGGSLEGAPLQRLVRTGIKLSRQRDPDTLLSAVAEAAIDVLEVERAFVVVLENGGTRIGASAFSPGVQRGNPSMSVVARTLQQRREVLATDLEERRELRSAASIQAMELRAALCMPLLDGPDLLGAIYVDSGNAVQNPLTEAAGHLRALAAFAATALSDLRRRDEARVMADDAADLVHDVRNMLTGVGLLLEEVVADQAAERWVLEDARDSSVALSRVNDLLRRFLDRATPAPETVNLRKITEEVLAQLRPLSRANGVILTCNGAPYAPVFADPQELPRAISNLIENSIKYGSDGGEVDVTIESDHLGVTLSVRDQGPGLPLTDGRLSPRAVRQRSTHDGHGRGMAIAKRVILAHGGHLTVGNHPDGGAFIIARLPAVDTAQDAEQSS